MPLDYEESGHKLLKVHLKEGEEVYFCYLLVLNVQIPALITWENE